MKTIQWTTTGDVMRATALVGPRKIKLSMAIGNNPSKGWFAGVGADPALRMLPLTKICQTREDALAEIPLLVYGAIETLRLREEPGIVRREDGTYGSPLPLWECDYV